MPSQKFPSLFGSVKFSISCSECSLDCLIAAQLERQSAPDLFRGVWRWTEIRLSAYHVTASCCVRVSTLSALGKPALLGQSFCIRPARKTPTCSPRELALPSIEKIRTEGHRLRSNSKRPGVIRSSAEAEAAACSQRQSLGFACVRSLGNGGF
jgi:hypothetical protein